MTVLKISLDVNKREFTRFTLGIPFVVFIQVYISIYTIENISKNPTFIEILEKNRQFNQ